MSKLSEILKQIETDVYENKQVADTILQQLGGNKFKAMTGAKTFVYDAKQKILNFRIGKNPKGINMVSIKLTPDDLYEMKFFKVRGADVKKIADIEGVFFDQLQKVFTEHTGLRTSL